jgi:hypothetical protein
MKTPFLSKLMGQFEIADCRLLSADYRFHFRLQLADRRLLGTSGVQGDEATYQMPIIFCK